MIRPEYLYGCLKSEGVEFFCGVPDSLLKDFNAYIMDNSENHIITANEGGAVALASGYHLATGKVPLVYMQNSGQGNCVNPLTSLVDSDVYSIPMILLIGWRGEPGVPDEPQHVKQGKVTIELLKTLGIPYEILSEEEAYLSESVKKAVNYAKENNSPYVLVVRKGSFESYKLLKDSSPRYELDREQAIKAVINLLGFNDIIVSTTGRTSRELFEYRKSLGQDHSRDFLTVGSMGHCSQIALGIALEKKEKNVYCFDGDGAVIMHMGALAIIGSENPNNFKHIVFNNGAHDSVGGQPTAGFLIDIPGIARACGYKNAWRAENSEEIKEKMKLLKESAGPALLEIRVNKGARSDLGRPTKTPQENKKGFMENLER